MAVDTLNSYKYKYDKVLYKTIGEFLYVKAKLFYSVFPYFSLLSSILFFIAVLNTNLIFIQITFLLAFSFTLFATLLTIFMISEHPNEGVIGVIQEGRKVNLKNLFTFGENKKIEYYAHIGISVHNFLGADKKEAVKYNLIDNNKKHDIALDSKTYCTGYLLPGSTGAGKTVSLYTTVFLPALISGNGFYYIEGKGDKTITSAIIAMAYQLGREEDLFVFDIGAATTGKYTNGINPLAIGSSKNVNELLKSLINIMTGDNAWVSDMMIAFMSALLEPLILLRDLNMTVDFDKLKNIHSLKDLKLCEKSNFNISMLLNYMNYQAAIDLLYMMRDLFNDNEFVNLVKLHENYAGFRNLTGTLLGQLERMLRNANVDIDTASNPDYSKIDPEVQRHNTKAVAGWVEALTVFGSEKYYGNVFNKDVPDIDIVNAIQTGKIIIFILPSMSATKEENKKIGGMAIALCKSAIGFMIEQGGLDATRKEQARQYRYRPRRLPYALVFDEPSNYATADISTMSSMVRSVGFDNGGMSIVWTGQSLGDMMKIDDNKGIAKDQLIANLGLIHTINVSDEGFKKLLKEKLGEHYVWREDQTVGKTDNNKDNSMRKEKELKYDDNFFEFELRPETGESLISLKGNKNEEKMICLFNEEPKCDFVLNKFISSYQLLKTIPTEDEARRELENYSHKIQQKLKDAEKYKADMEKDLKKNFNDVIKSWLVELANIAYPDLEGVSNFNLELLEEVNPSAHGSYETNNSTIRIYNAINKSREHLFATAIHELTHHTEYLLYGDTGHSPRFYGILYDYLSIAMGIERFNFDYNEAKRLKMFDSNDLNQMEKLFGSPKKKDMQFVNEKELEIIKDNN